MKRTTVSLPDDLAWLLEREAKRHDTSASEIVRKALTHHFGLDSTEPRHIPFAKLGRSGYTDTSERFDEILAAEWPKHIGVDERSG